jgi:hypothetical protein
MSDRDTPFDQSDAAMWRFVLSPTKPKDAPAERAAIARRAVLVHRLREQAAMFANDRFGTRSLLLEAASVIDGANAEDPIPMRITCPACRLPHIDEGEWASRPHRTHLCAECGLTWRPCERPTVGVAAP